MKEAVVAWQDVEALLAVCGAASAERLRAERLRAGLTMRELGEAVSDARPTKTARRSRAARLIEAWEYGERRLSNPISIMLLAERLGCDVRKLFDTKGAKRGR